MDPSIDRALAAACMPVQRTNERTRRLRESMAAVVRRPWRSWSDLDMARTLRPDLSHMMAGRGRPRRISLLSHPVFSSSLRMHAAYCIQLSATIPVLPSLWKMFVFAPAVVSHTMFLLLAPWHACMHVISIVHDSSILRSVYACTLNVQAPNPEKPSPPLCLLARVG